MSSRGRILAIIGAAGFFFMLWTVQFFWDYADPDSPANAAMQYQLKLFGAAMYEYHAATGHWPESLDDLAHTSLPVTSYVWRQTATTMVFVQPQHLKDKPKDNAGVVILYTDKGLFNNLGRMWVCWGDLRTEHLPEADLRKQLEKQKAPAKERLAQ